MHPAPVVAVAATGLELDDGRIISVAVTEAHRARSTVETLDKELSERMKAARAEPDRQRAIETAFRRRGAHARADAAAQAEYRELGRVLRMYQSQLARQYIDGSDETRAATRHAFKMASRADPHAVEAFIRSVLECPDAVAQERGPGVVRELLQPNLSALLASYAAELGGDRALDALEATVGASIAVYNATGSGHGKPPLPELAALLQEPDVS